MLRSSQPCSPRRVCSEARSYAELLCWVSSGWMVASTRTRHPARNARSAGRLHAGDRPVAPCRRAQRVEGIEVFGVASITQLVAFLQGIPMPPVEPIEVIGERAGKHANRRLHLADVVGQVEAKWDCEVAVASAPHALPLPTGSRQDHAR
jgi:predicted ATPase with chaperone activity